MSRYVVTHLSGWPISKHGNHSNSRVRPKQTWYVLDSAYCYRVVASYDNDTGHYGKTYAEHAAQMLNLEDAYENARAR